MSYVGRTLLALALAVFLGCPSASTPGGILQDADAQSDGENAALDTAFNEGWVCVPGQTLCMGSNFLRCRSDGSDYEVTPCPADTVCTKEGCAESVCTPSESVCDGADKVKVCLADGSGFTPATRCPQGTTCVGGLCVSAGCSEMDEAICTKTSVLTCDGGKWKEEPCPKGFVCFKAQCIECFSDDHCPEGMKCQSGICTALGLVVATTDLPQGQVGENYEAQLEAKGGQGPYVWTLSKGLLPKGVDLAKDGSISGKPDEAGEFSFTVRVEDQQGMQAEAELAVVVVGQEVQILSKSPLPDAESEADYSFVFKAGGGTPPYGWMVVEGELPAGLVLLADGNLKGVPTVPGDYSFSIRVVDSSSPPQWDARQFALKVKVAPLRIVGDQMLDVFLTKVVVLPLITVVEGIPIPYSTQLLAKGGVKPYHWKELEIPGGLKQFIPKAGVPDGLTLSDDGKLSGAVSSTDQVIELKLPFLQFTLRGFFFVARVTDSQDPPDSDQAIFLIPTVPVNLGGGGGLPFP